MLPAWAGLGRIPVSVALGIGLFILVMHFDDFLGESGGINSCQGLGRDLSSRIPGAIFVRWAGGSVFGALGVSGVAGGVIVVGRVRECMDGPRLLRMRLGESVPRSLGWNCALGVGDWRLSPPCTRWRGIALLGLGVGVSPLFALVSVGLRSWGWVVDPSPGVGGRGWLRYV